MSEKNVPEVRFRGFSGEWELLKLLAVAEFNPKAEIPDTFQYVDLESVAGTQLIGSRKENKKTAPSRAQRVALQGDVFFQTVRPYQKNNYMFDMPYTNYIFSTGYAQLRPFGDSYCLLSFLQNAKFVKKVLNDCTGTSYPAINSTSLSNIIISYAQDTDEQTKIGEFFKNLDNLIAQNQKKYDKLLNMKKACLDKMFPKDGADTPEVRFKGVSGKWEKKHLENQVEFYSGLTYSPLSIVNNSGTLVLRSSNVKHGEVVNADNIYVDSSVVNCQNVKIGDIIVVVRNGSRGLIGKHGKIKTEMKNTVIGAFMTGIKSPQPDFATALLDTIQFNREIEKNLGATINQITTGSLKKMFFSFTDDNAEQAKIGTFFQTLDNLIALQKTKLEKLKNIKKACLDKMFI